ncbi:MAG: radical SAM family heme chaperone HemW [Deltaproteobacteria bacterium]|nr:radical SAM family heme chaperone HemW [Deltaproteobacteria bacterium]
MRLQPENQADPSHAGLYIHVPFCVRKCVYCDFYSITDLDRIEAYVQGLQKEMALTEAAGLAFDTVYLGGGTPSVLGPEHLEAILGAVSDCFCLSSRPEVTLEANPNTVCRDRVASWMACGVNRINIGVQSFDDTRLAFLKRLHSGKQAHCAIRSVRTAGMNNVGLDLIYGLPDQRPEEWLDDLKEAVQYAPEHLSCYMLTYEQGTPLYRLYKQGRVRALEEDRVRALFDLTVGFLTDMGYEQYEISNFSQEKIFRSRHNQKYWDHTPYIGLGPSAHSFREKKRSWNHADLTRYLAELAQGHLPVESFEILNRSQLMLETVYLGLRTSTGIRIDRFKERFHVDFYEYFDEAFEELDRRGLQGLVAYSPEQYVLTDEGRAFADAVASVFAAYVLDADGHRNRSTA